MGNYWQYNTMPKATCAGLLIEGGSKSKGPPWAPGFVLNAKLGAGKLREGEEFVICESAIHSKRVLPSLILPPGREVAARTRDLLFFEERLLKIPPGSFIDQATATQWPVL
jgi:hypothetical protein